MIPSSFKEYFVDSEPSIQQEIIDVLLSLVAPSGTILGKSDTQPVNCPHCKDTSVVANGLWETGIQYLKGTLPLFDQGGWSWYWINENPPHYVASMMYHNLHVVQLYHIYNTTGEEVFKDYAEQFDSYKRSFLGRINAGIHLIKGKIRL